MDERGSSIVAERTYTPYQAQYWSHLLTLAGVPEDEISRSVASARVDMNPHQVEAALFAIRSPLSKGVILADEVGLGKTVEASLVIAQKWSERKRRVLLIVPASLRKQWAQELQDKFGISSLILDSKIFNKAQKDGTPNAFDSFGKVVIVSYQFAARKSSEVAAVPWHLVIFDEAHKLRNVWKKDGGKIAKTLTNIAADKHKVLLSATPLQNSLMELFGLVSVIDPMFFGGDAAFKQLYGSGRPEALQELKMRLKNICWRTLRRQVQAEGGINFTNRHSITEDFTPSDEENDLYQKVSEFLQRPTTKALGKGNKALLTLVIRKILASSSFAIAGTLKKMIDRIEQDAGVDSEALADYELIDETIDEYEQDGGIDGEADDPALLKRELEELKQYYSLAKGIQDNAKGHALVRALETSLNKAVELKGQRKAVIFTESCRTQQYLKDLLAANGYGGKIVLLNGSNADPASQKIYTQWLTKHKGTDRISGSKAADMKAALVEEFKESAEIMIATESGAEGINLQFCSLVINYDLPWNPQRVEQRIGRCHRYGQAADVVVLNFINKRNRADERVFELLDQKFKLFEGVFGCSDEILGAIESGVDIEQRILSVYQNCRTPEEIEESFAKLQEDLDELIQTRDEAARKILLEHFDEKVLDVLRNRREATDQRLTENARTLMNLTRAVLGDSVTFLSERSFNHAGEFYSVDWRESEEKEGKFFRISDQDLCDKVIESAKQNSLGVAKLSFHYDSYGAQLSDLKPFIGKQGWLKARKLKVDSIQPYEKVLLSAYTIDGEELDESLCHRLFNIPAVTSPIDGQDDTTRLNELLDKQRKTCLDEVRARNKEYFDEESEKLDRWAEESKKSLTLELESLESEIKQARKAVRQLNTLDEKVAAKRQIKSLETKRDKKQMEFFESRTKIGEQQEKLLDEVEAQLTISDKSEELFLIQWELR